MGSSPRHSGIAGPKPPRPSFSKPLDNNSLQLSAARDPLVKDFTEARDTVQGRAVLMEGENPEKHGKMGKSWENNGKIGIFAVENGKIHSEMMGYLVI